MEAGAQNNLSDSDDSGGDELQSTSYIKQQWLEIYECDEYLDEDWPQEPEQLEEQNERRLPPPDPDTILRLVRERTAENAVSTVLNIGRNLPPTNVQSNNVRPQYSNGNCAFPQHPQPNVHPHGFGAAPVPVLMPHQPHLPNNVMGNIPGMYLPFPFMQQTNINGYMNQPPPNMIPNQINFPSMSSVGHFPPMPVDNSINHQNRPPPPPSLPIHPPRIDPRLDPRLERHRAPPLQTQPLQNTHTTLSEKRPTGRPNGVTNQPTNNQRVVYRSAPINRRRISMADYKMKGQLGGRRSPDESNAPIHSDQTNQSHKETEKERNGEINISETMEIEDSRPSAETEAVFSPAESVASSTPTSQTPDPQSEPESNDNPPTEHESSKEPEEELNGNENNQTAESEEINYDSEDSVASDDTNPFDVVEFKQNKLLTDNIVDDVPDVKVEVEIPDESADVPVDDHGAGNSDIEEPYNETSCINELISEVQISQETVKRETHELNTVQNGDAQIKAIELELELNRDVKVVLRRISDDLIEKYVKKRTTLKPTIASRSNSPIASTSKSPIASTSKATEGATWSAPKSKPEPKHKTKGILSELEALREDIAENCPEIVNLSTARRACTWDPMKDSESEQELIQESESEPALDSEWMPEDQSGRSDLEWESNSQPKPKSKKKLKTKKTTKTQQQSDSKPISKRKAKGKLSLELDALNEDIAENCADVLQLKSTRRTCTLNAPKIVESPTKSDDEPLSKNLRPGRIPRRRYALRFSLDSDEDDETNTRNVETEALPPSPPPSANTSPSPVLPSLSPSPPISPLPSPSQVSAPTPAPAPHVDTNKMPNEGYAKILICLSDEDDDENLAVNNSRDVDPIDNNNNDDPIEISSDSD